MKSKINSLLYSLSILSAIVSERCASLRTLQGESFYSFATCRAHGSGAEWIRSPVTFFEVGSGFEFSGKSRIRYVWYGVRVCK